MYLCLAGLICKTNPLHFFASSICDFTVNWLIHAMFLWGIDYLHFHSDKPKCIGVWDGTCPKPSRDYKAENRADLGPSFAPPRWVPFSHGDTQHVMLHKATNHHAAPSAPHHCPKTSAGNCGSAQSTKCGAALVPHVCSLRYKSGHAHGQMPQPPSRGRVYFELSQLDVRTAAAATSIALMLWRSMCETALAAALGGDQSSILHS